MRMRFEIVQTPYVTREANRCEETSLPGLVLPSGGTQSQLCHTFFAVFVSSLLRDGLLCGYATVDVAANEKTRD